MTVKMIQDPKKEWRHRAKRYKKCLTNTWKFKQQTELEIQ